MEINPSDIRSMVHIATRRTGAPIRDEDLEQEIALHAVEAFRRIGDVKSPHALLMKIVLDAVREHWRRRRSSEDLDSIDERLLAEPPAFETDLDSRRREELLKRALDRLPASKRLLIDLFYTRDCSTSEIARLQGKSVSAVKMELLRCRQSLGRIIRSFATKKSP